ncbi:MAG: L-lactate dehydrogenase [Myxococcota bacterium]
MKIAIIGMGYVGSSVAISTLQTGFARELLLNDINIALAEGEAMDLAHGSPFYSSAKVRAAAIEDMVDCDAVVISAGRGGKPGESRLQLLAENIRIMRDIASRLRACRGVIVVVSNPVDVLTKVVTETSGLPPARVIGTGTMLDTARLRHALGREFDISSRSINAHVIGEHGDSEVVMWSTAEIGGRPLRQFSGWTVEREERVTDEVRRAAQEIIKRKGATNHAIGLVTAALLRWTLRGDRRVLTVARVQDGVLGMEDVALSLPTIVGADGATEVLEPSLDLREREALHRSAEILRKALAEAEARDD